MHPSLPDFEPTKTTPAATLGDRLRTLPQYLLPRRFITRVAYRLTRARAPWFKNLLIRAFIAVFKVNMDEAAESDPAAYADFNQFFTRALRPEARPLTAEEDAPCCPVDGIISQAGVINGETLFQAKGRTFSLTQLLGGDAQRARSFRDGSFATLYLSPRDYHRIHMPVRGHLREMVHIPGRLLSVSPLITRVVPALFARNERLVSFFDTEVGPMAIVMVGAINVASMETIWGGVITPPLGTQIRRWSYPQTQAKAIILDQGAEMGRFNMGSTVIVLFGKNAVRWDSILRPEVEVRMGQRLGESVGAA